MQTLSQRIHKARGVDKVDFVIRNCNVLNVFSGEIHLSDVGIDQGVFLGFGNYTGHRDVDAEGRFLLPGLVEGHIHIESTLLTPPHFAQVVAARGTSAVVCDPHEIANVLGRDGVEYMLEASRDLPVSIFFMVPSCVPASNMDTSGAEFDAEDVAYFLRTYPDRVLGLAELMDFPGVLSGDPKVMAELEAAKGKLVDGHAPLLTGMDLNAYACAGPSNDHECTIVPEALEKLRAGMHVMIREGSLERNLEDLVGAVNSFNAQNISLVTDDRNVRDLRVNGHLDYTVRRAVELGIPPVRAVQMASINTARHFGLTGFGAVAPGYRANCFLVDDLESFSIHQVFLQGKPLEEHDFSARAVSSPTTSMNVGESITESTFAPDSGQGDIRVIGVTPGLLLTKKLELTPTLRDGMPVADPQRDICKLTVIERHKATGNHATGFTRGLGLQRGALAGTVAHDSHNLVVAGMNDADMVLAARAAIDQGGGYVAVLNGEVLAVVSLPVAGLMSDQDPAVIADAVDALDRAAEQLGCSFNPFMLISFLTLSVIPELKLTDRGLVDGVASRFVSLWTDPTENT